MAAFWAAPQRACARLSLRSCKIAGNYAEVPARLETMTCTGMIDALATVQAVGVTREGHVTGMALDVSLEPRFAKAIYSDPDAFRQFVGTWNVQGCAVGAKRRRCTPAHSSPV
jgi:hypothetical protein